MYYSEVEKPDRKIRPYGIENLDSLKSVDWRQKVGITACKVGLYTYKGEVINEESEDEIVYKFDDTGRIVDQTYLMGKYIKKFEYEGDKLTNTSVTNISKNKNLQNCTFEYDSEGKLIREIKEKDRMKLSWIASGVAETKCKGNFTIDYTYNENDLVTQIMIHANEGKYEYYRVRNTYDEEGQLLEKEICKRGYTSRGDLSKTFSKANCGTKYTYSYDSEGRVQESSFYMPTKIPGGYTVSKNPEVRSQNQFNERGELVAYSSFNSDGTLKAMTSYKYDEEGNIIESTTKKSAESFGTKLINNYKNGLLIMKMETAEDNSLTSMTSFSYDNNGIIKQIIMHDPVTRNKSKAVIISYQ